MQDSREQSTEADRDGLLLDQKTRKRKKRMAKRPLEERMFSHLKRMSRGTMRSDFLNAITAQLVVFSVEFRYSKKDLMERIDDLYTCVEQGYEKQRR